MKILLLPLLCLCQIGSEEEVECKNSEELLNPTKRTDRQEGKEEGKGKGKGVGKREGKGREEGKRWKGKEGGWREGGRGREGEREGEREGKEGGKAGRPSAIKERMQGSLGQGGYWGSGGSCTGQAG